MTAADERSRGSRPLPVISAAVLILVMAVAAAAFVAHRDADENAPATPSTPRPASVATSTGPTPGFGVPEIDQFGRRIDIPADPAGHLRPQTSPTRASADPDWLTAAPAGLGEPGGWQRVHGAVVPFSTSDGPTVVRDGVAGGYAHTPQGAALAAVMSVYQVIARPADRAVLAQRLVLTDADRARFDAGIAAGRLPQQQPASLTRSLMAHDAFRVESYAEDLAVIGLAVRVQPPHQAASWITTRVPMVWVDGDWRLRCSGEQLPTATITTLTGWTRWS
ncbi:hypothetical protein IU434_26415 [Nocardia farcinica]|uniref:hypothetical protein n=1 Tax=Nocardia farcinica TaxID=37329 RepID=UPI001894B074|nr:hypothetical protein [Nocardia farcinica]MBF6445542.1 hypothetical protein [Nocardia farcinica]